MKISLVIYPSDTSIIINLSYIPRKGEEVVYKNKLYLVGRVIHNVDEKTIKIMVASEDF